MVRSIDFCAFECSVEGCCDDRAAFVEANPGENLKMGL